MSDSYLDKQMGKCRRGILDWDDIEYNWLKNEPRWWRKLFKHRKRRAEQRQLLTEVTRDLDYGEGIVFPLDKKPWEYYW